MKGLPSILFGLFLLFASHSTQAQVKEGYIVYEDKTDIHSQLPPEREAMKDQIPQFRTREKILYFKDFESLYTNIPKELATTEVQDFSQRRNGRRGGGRRFGRGGQASKVYVDLSENAIIKEQDLFGKKFLVKGNNEAKAWKITGKQKQVGDFLCQEATYQDSTQQIVAWFTPMIPVSVGPEEFRGLPGAVLRVELQDGLRILTAKKIITEPLEENVIVKPTEGEEIGQKDYDVLRKEKMEEMRKEFGNRRRGEGRS